MINRFQKVLDKNLKPFNNLYALCDIESLKKHNITISNFLKISSKQNAKIIQYRDKISSKNTKIENLKYISKNSDAIIIVNDSIDLIEYASGIHLGQEDFFKISVNKKEAVKIIRKKIGNKLLGLSTHNKKEVLEANSLDLDMIGLGAYRNTSTKSITNVLGDDLSKIAALSNHPVCAIGGVKLDDKLANVRFNVIASGLYT
ncbi:MAG: thiamine phosphate synthase [Campylobacterota bacterium]